MPHSPRWPRKRSGAAGACCCTCVMKAAGSASSTSCAYRLQDQGFDTIEANQRLGLPSEARDFPVAARMLSLLGVKTIRLMTNNPAKVAAFESSAVTVVERVPHSLPANPHNTRYLATKRDKAGHLLT